MSQSVLFFGFGLFVFCLACHIIVWRISLSRISSLLLVILFLGVPAVGIIPVLLIADTRTVEIFEILLLHVSLSSAYIASYPAVRAVSPTLDIMMMIASSRGQKIAGDEIMRTYADKKLVTARIDDLKIYKLMIEENDHVRLSRLATFIIVCFILFRKTLGLPAGRG